MRHLSYKSQGRTWYHPSVLELMKECCEGQRPEDRIIEKARERIAHGTNSGWSGPPFDPHQLASILGIRTRETDAIEAEAQIIPIGKQFELHFRRDVTDTRLNFTICHEIAHTLFPDCAEMIRERNARRRSFDPNREVEYLCDIGAAEILMPSPYFDEDLKKEGKNLVSVQLLSQRYLASREAVIRRIPAASSSPCAVVYLCLGYNKKELSSVQNPILPFSDVKIDKPKARLRIANVYPSRAFDIFLPRNKSIPDDSMLYNLLAGDDYVSCEERWNIEKFGKRFIEGLRLYNTQGTSRLGIIALVN